MPVHGGAGEMGYVGERNPRLRLHLLGDGAQSGAQYDADFRRDGRGRPQKTTRRLDFLPDADHENPPYLVPASSEAGGETGPERRQLRIRDQRAAEPREEAAKGIPDHTRRRSRRSSFSKSRICPLIVTRRSRTGLKPCPRLCLGSSLPVSQLRKAI